MFKNEIKKWLEQYRHLDKSDDLEYNFSSTTISKILDDINTDITNLEEKIKQLAEKYIKEQIHACKIARRNAMKKQDK